MTVSPFNSHILIFLDRGHSKLHTAVLKGVMRDFEFGAVKIAHMLKLRELCRLGVERLGSSLLLYGTRKFFLHLVPVASVSATAFSMHLERTSEEVMWDVED